MVLAANICASDDYIDNIFMPTIADPFGLSNDDHSWKISDGLYENEEEKSNNELDLEINELHKQIVNLKKLNKFISFPDNWDGFGAKPISSIVLKKVMNFIVNSDLKYQPIIVPSPRNSIQLEYITTNNDYLEIEVFEEKISLYYEKDELIENELESVETDIAIRYINGLYA